MLIVHLIPSPRSPRIASPPLSQQPTLLRHLRRPPLPHGRHINPAPLGPLDDPPRPPHHRRIDHLPIQRPRAPPLGRRLHIRHHDAHRPLDLPLARAERRLHQRHLRRVDALLAREAHLAAARALCDERARRGVGEPLRVRRGRVGGQRRREAGVGGVHEVDDAGQAGGGGVRDERLAREEELGERGRARQRQRQREVLGGEDEAREVRRRGADGAQVRDGARRLDEREDADRGLGAGGRVRGVPRRQQLAQDVGHEGEVGGGVDLGDDEGVDVVRAVGEQVGEVGEGVRGRGGVDAHGDLGARARGEGGAGRGGGGGGGGEEGREGGARGGLEVRGDGVFEVVHEGVGGEGEGFLEHLLRGCGDCGDGGLVRRWRMEGEGGRWYHRAVPGAGLGRTPL